MELMSSLLLCALVLQLVQALGQTVIRTNTEIKYNTSKWLNQKSLNHKKILLNINGPPLVNVVSELQSVFIDISCNQCILCMERALKAYKNNLHHIDRPNVEELQEEVLTNRFLVNANRVKRNSAVVDSYDTSSKKTKTKIRKHKLHKSVNVNKFNANGAVYALKVNETNTVDDGHFNETRTYSSTCNVYSVKKSFPCETPEAKLLLTVSKRKSNKKSRKEKDREITTTTEKKVTYPIFRKRHVDHSHVPDNSMPSMEEMY